MMMLRSRMICYLLAVLMLIGMWPAQTVSAEEISDVYTFQWQTVAQDPGLPENDELFAAYAEQQLFGANFAFFGTAAGERLQGDEKRIYDAAVPIIKQIADGSRSSAIISMGQTVSDSDGNLYVPDVEVNFYGNDLSEESLNRIVEALLSDLPYEMYWFDKVTGCGVMSAVLTKLEYVQLQFTVASNYRGADSTTTDVKKTGAASTARENAKDVVASCGVGYTDYSMLCAFRDEICNLVSYDHNAAEKLNFTTNADPWQVIFVFDYDPFTNVVCEGYAKAFMLLCDLYSFDSDVACYTVSGTLNGGNHMWNIVTLDGVNYLVDVTNSDSGMYGESGTLFMVEGEGSITEGYMVAGLHYVYDEETIDLWGTGSDSILRLGPTDGTGESDGENEGGSGEGGSGEGGSGEGDPGDVAEDFTWKFEDGILTLSGHGAMPEYGYPAEFPWFSVNESIEEIVIEEGITSVAPYSCYATNAISITIPDSVVVIEERAFGNNRMLKSISVGSGNPYFTVVDGVLFSKDMKTLILYPAGKEDSTYQIPDGVTKLRAYAFENCEKLINITIPESVINMRYCTFSECTSLVEVVIPSQITEIGASMFSGCTSLKKVVIPDSVTAIGMASFYFCHALEDLVLPQSLTGIGIQAFERCDSLKKVEIPDQVQIIGRYAFQHCYGLETAEIGAGVQEIGEAIFSGCHNLEEIIVSEENEFFIVEEGALLDKEKTHLYQYAPGRKATHYEVPNTVKEIGPFSFYWNEHLQEVVLLEGLHIIGSNAFAGCSSIEEAHLPASVTEIGESAFNWCVKLKEVKIPVGVKELTPFVFYACKDLEKVVLQNGLTRLDSYAFGECESLEEIILPASLSYIGYGAFADCYHLKAISIPSKVNRIDGDAFRCCHELTDVTICDGVEEIGEWAFDSIGATVITIPKSVTKIETGAFPHHEGAIKIVFLGNVPSLADSIFSTYWWDRDPFATIYYPAGNKTWTAEIRKDYGVPTIWKSYKGDYPDLEETPIIKKPVPIMTVSGDTVSGKPVVQWGWIQGAVEYQLFRKIGADGKYQKIATFTNNTPYTDESAEAGIKYYYRMKAVYKDDIESDYCSGKARTCDLPQPVVTISNTASTGRIKLSWNKIDGASKYYVYRWNSKTEEYDKIKTTTSTSYTDTTAVAGTSYTYRVTAVHENSSANSAKSEKVKCTCDLPQPVVTASNTASTGCIKLSWNKIAGASKYYVYRWNSKTEEYDKIKTTTSASYTDTTAVAGTSYTYRVTAVHENSSANSAKSEKVKRTCDLAQPVVKESNVSSSGKVKLEWQKIEGVEKYKIYRRVGKTGDYEYYKSTTSTSFTDSDNKAGNVYYYQVKAAHSNSSADSAKSSAVGQTCKLARPDVTIALSSGNPKLTWGKISGTTEYKVYRATSKDGTYKSVKATTSTSFTDKDVTAGKTYYYKVKAIHSNSSANSAYSSVDYIKAK